MNKILTIFFLSTLCIQCNTKSKTSPVDKTYGLITEKAMVVSAREEASKIGVNRLDAINQNGGLSKYNNGSPGGVKPPVNNKAM